MHRNVIENRQTGAKKVSALRADFNHFEIWFEICRLQTDFNHFEIWFKICRLQATCLAVTSRRSCIEYVIINLYFTFTMFFRDIFSKECVYPSVVTSSCLFSVFNWQRRVSDVLNIFEGPCKPAPSHSVHFRESQIRLILAMDCFLKTKTKCILLLIDYCYQYYYYYH